MIVDFLAQMAEYEMLVNSHDVPLKKKSAVLTFVLVYIIKCSAEFCTSFQVRHYY